MDGIFLSLDGVDGAGKSTQVELLCNWLEKSGRATLSIRDPGGTPLGESLREILLHRHEIPLSMTSEMMLYMASRAELVQSVVRPALAEGKCVIADRYLMANIVYQGYAGGLNVEDIRRVGVVATGGLQPQLTMVLDLPVELALQRLPESKDRLESRGAAYMQRVREGFLTESKLSTTTVMIDATLPTDQVHQQILSFVQPLLA
ncbi:MAG: dTMP kinase [Planctomycetales bacterium]|nr:dTMP kinase [Planctomycetales bacterium]